MLTLLPVDGAGMSTTYHVPMNFMRFRLLTGTICKMAVCLLFPMGLRRTFFWVHGHGSALTLFPV
jgi:hypothetical protein